MKVLEHAGGGRKSTTSIPMALLELLGFEFVAK